MSLSRKKEDKVNNTGRFHLMKNRYGMDGLTFSVNADTSTGHFEVFDYQDSEDQNNLPHHLDLISLILMLILLINSYYAKSFSN